MANENECCPDWKPQSDKINGFIIFQSTRAGRDLYDGIPYRFCPWCGTPRPKKAETIAVAAPEGS